MPKIGDMFPSRWLKAKDCEDQDLVLTIKELIQEEVGGENGKEEKWVIYFQDHEKGLVLNTTNTNTIASIHGDDTDDWEDKRIALFATEVEFKGKQTMGIRVRLRAPKAKSKGAAAAAAPAQVATNGDEEEGDPEIPF